MRGEPIDPSSFTSTYTSRDVSSPLDESFDEESMTSTTKVCRKARGQMNEDDDEEWVVDAPKRKAIKMPASAEKVTKRVERDYITEFKNTILNDKMESTEQKMVVKSELVKTEPVPSKSSNIIVSYLKRNDGLKNNLANVGNLGNAGNVAASSNVQQYPGKMEKIVMMPKREIRIKAKENQAVEVECPVKQSKLNVSFYFIFSILFYSNII